MPNPSRTKVLDRHLARKEYPLGLKDGSWYTIFKDFIRLPIATQAAGNDEDFDLTGSGTVPAPTFLTPSAGYGGILLATRTASAADNDEARLFPLTTSRWGQAVVPTAGQISVLEARVRIGASIASTAFYFGWKLTDTCVVDTDANQALFYFDTDALLATTSANLRAITSVANVDASQDTGFVVAVNTDVDLRIEILQDLKARYYVNNALVATAATAFTNPNLIPTFGVVSRADAGAAKSHGLRFIRMSRFAA